MRISTRNPNNRPCPHFNYRHLYDMDLSHRSYYIKSFVMNYYSFDRDVGN